ncbi:MAG: AarF/ABC1/UbiB kinase family protein [Gemmataceae bacterium]|nr:AarF/ABC1/UbiB kinase family protein [Gemmataceae bacterium]
MKITSIPQIARNVNRFREIGTILSKYGLADWISRLDIGFARGIFKSTDGLALANETHESRIRLALTELGPTFIKLGQVLSTRGDIVGLELARELTKLQDSAPGDPFPLVRSTIEAELGQPLRDLYTEFEEKPLASASIAQVHRARLASGEWVVVKVQHKGLEAKIRTDLDILVGLAELAEQHIDEVKKYRPRAVAAEFQRVLLRELDFGREERNLQQFAANFAADATVHFPTTYPELSTSRVLTMQFLEGTKISQPEQLKELGIDLEDTARRGAVIFLEMIFRDGFYHADPHPGNILVLPGGTIGLVDCGMVGRLDEKTREDVEEMLLAIGGMDAVRLTGVITRVGSVPPQLDQAALGADVSEFLAYYGGRSLKQLNLGQALTEMVEIVRLYQILLPANISLLLKALVMLEGTSRALNPGFDMLSLLKPYKRRMLRRYLSPARRLRKLQHLLREWQHLGEVLPRSLADILLQLQNSRFEVHLEHKHLEPTVNRLVYGMLTSALFLGSALLMSHKVPPEFYGLSIPGAIGFGLSSVQAARLYWAIRNSGRLD